MAVDPTSKQKDEQLPTYNAYSPDGDMTAPLVYVNYGLVADYEELARHGVSVKGAMSLPAMENPGEASSLNLPRSTAPLGASFIPIRPMTAIASRTFFPKAHASTRGSAARQRAGRSALPWRSPKPGSRSDQRGQAPQAGGCPIPCQDSGAAHLLC